jgi:hypothetical protein
MKHFDISLLLVVSQKVMPDVYVLCAAVLNRIFRHADSTLCWGEGKDATLRSRPPPQSLV